MSTIDWLAFDLVTSTSSGQPLGRIFARAYRYTMHHLPSPHPGRHAKI